jgi:acyl-CoA thioesterase
VTEQRAFLEEIDRSFAPGDQARGPWGEDSLHGRILAGLFAREFERAYGAADFQFSRLTVDLFRMPRMQPLSVQVEAIREGRRIRAVAGSIQSGGVEIARATAILLRRSETTPGKVWKPAPWDAPLPDEIEPPPRRGEGWVPAWEMRSFSGPAFGGSGQKRAWLRDTRELVAGEPLSPFVRVALAADIASPMANSGDAGLEYVNADITLYLHRLPVGEWLGWEVATHQNESGVAVGGCTIYDEQGAVGSSTVCAVSNTRP